MSSVYIAYGPNLNTAEMARQCPTAMRLGASELKDYRLVFRGKQGEAVAKVEPLKGGRVPVMVWELTPDDETALDRCEGFPLRCRKETVTIALNRKRVKAMAYILNEGVPLGLPSRHYYGLVSQGYRDASFDERVLASAIEGSKNEAAVDDT